MGHITVNGEAVEARALQLEMEPSALAMAPVDEWTDLVAGYEVMAVRPSTHDGVPATLITLGDSLGQREVGILRIRNDAVREAQLEVTRLFESEQGRDEFVESLKARPAILDDSYELVEARTVNVGDTIFVDSDPDDDELEDGTVKVTKVEFDVIFDADKGRPIVTLHRDWRNGSTFIPGEWGDYAPDAKVWVKRA